MKIVLVLLILLDNYSFKHRITKKEINKVLREAMREYRRLPKRPERVLAQEDKIDNTSNYLID